MKRYQRRARLAVLCLTALGLFGCDDEPAPLYQIPGTGSVEGFVFFDADRNGVFDPSAGDSALKGVRVALRERGTTETLAGGTATSGTTGRFTIASVPPGTHDLAIDTLSAPGTKFCQNPVPVDVYLNEQQFSAVSGRIACVISIAKAEQTLNQVVVIQGIVSSSPGQVRSSYTYIQDETGGIRIFSSVPEGKGIAIGDLIEVTGTVSSFSGDLQLGGAVVLGTVTKNVLQPTPLVLTTKQVATAGTDPASPELGMLVTLRKVKFTTTFGFGGINGRNAWIDDGSGRTQIRFEIGMFPGGSSTAEAQAALNLAYPVSNKCYNVTGVTGAFNGDGQIFPRTLADVVEVPCT